ncbi:mechanosensitive ion channel [Pelagibius litoralis]|uniref:Small-conductance mechanosensitive channel n=1 Tax=Pelagibius litoralis TaxID=374515 RepID=A0A967K988_9PROT|nr:mechanosensitive ion channel domain-containing protein [Pelagibius litoralis]NIA70888.1 mechanosensitive ion channel [Pelagibius litoralis]
MDLSSTQLEQLSRLGDLLLSYAVDLLAGIVLLGLGWFFAGWARRAVLRLLERTPRMDRTLRPVIASVVRYAILVLVVVAVLAQFGVQTTSIIAILGAAGIAVGLALQGTLQNIAAGMMLLFLRPFQVGDYIDAEGLAGTVDEIGLFVTQLTTFDGLYHSVPNARLWNAAIVNYSRLPTRRLDLKVGISYDDDIAKAQKILLGLLQADQRVIDSPPPQVLVLALADSAVELNLRGWCNRDDYWDLLFDLTKTVKLTLDEAGFTIPFPQREVRVVGDPATGLPGDGKTVND